MESKGGCSAPSLAGLKDREEEEEDEAETEEERCDDSAENSTGREEDSIESGMTLTLTMWLLKSMRRLMSMMTMGWMMLRAVAMTVVPMERRR